uniref:phosphatidylinositol-3,5-bisphosphate 3-phosphatase n=1 Tax=Globisporangium ultimum (strain ATCC 200006 / CBS 805.95 / DAOM BR144) TaxID=431595 RepID=K3W822_GLOUD
MDRRAQIQTPIDFTTTVSKPRAIPHSNGHHHHSVNTSTLDDARLLFSTSPLEVVGDASAHHYTSNRNRDAVAPSSAPTASSGVPQPLIQTAASPSSNTPSRLSAVETFLTSQSPHSSNQSTQYAHPHHYNSSQRPQHQRKKSVPWVPDSLAEKCYGCHASFTLVLRRHHCRRCGNVFCDTCSSARIPLVSAGFFTPVRVCEKCCVAAKKAHAKMMEEKMQQQQMLRKSEEEYLLFPQAPSADAVLGRRGSVPTTTTHQHQRAMTDSVAVASGMFFQQPVHRSHTYEGEMTNRRSASGLRRSSVQFGRIDHLYDDRELDSDGGSTSQDYRMQTLPGEIGMICSENVRIRFMERVDHMGTLYLTNYRIVFSPYIGGSSPPSPVDLENGRDSADLSVNTKNHIKEDELPYASDFHTEAVHAYQAINIVSVERLKKKEMAESDSGMIDIVCKDFRHVQFFFSGLVSKQTFSKFDRTYSLIRQHAFGEPSGPQPEFAKLSMESFDGAPDGWKVYNPVAEFQRLGVSSSSRWRISQSNLKYTVCPTYPSLYAVPATVSDSVLAVAAKFRSKGRIPVLSWRDIHTGAVICRSSQPLVGLSQKQCDKDVFLIQAIAAANPSSSKLVIIDARPWKNAAAQKTLGRAGYELTDHYETRHATASLKYADMVASAAAAAETSAVNSPVNGVGEFELNMNSIGAPTSAGGSSAYGDEDDSMSDRMQLLEAMESSSVLTECKLLFMGIENIHTMRKSYNKLLDLCVGKQSNDKWLDLLSSTHWLEHISRILDSAVEIVRLIKEEKSSVLIHCSDGWDRTAQLTSLAQLMVDPYYRTVQGFQVLIEKEWCSFGHKFRDRTGHGLSNASSEISPVFLQWIDCVWQMMTQFPSSFQFNERYLILILDHLYSCRFGTFLYNSQRARVEEESNHPTVSLWTYLSTIDRAVIVNPFYHPHEAPRKKWKSSVTATRQVFEIPQGDERLHRNNNDSNEERSALEQQQQERTNRRYTGGESVVHTDNSSLSSSCDGYETDNSEIQRVNENELDEFINDMRAELDINKARNGLTQKQPRDFDSEDGDFEAQADALASSNRSSVFHKIVPG